jgi:uncharacterized protein YdhG (YjbR/CyaY superfamily)
MTTIESVIESFPPPQAHALATLRAHLLELLPDVTEDLTWGMPTLRIHGVIVVSFLGFTHHNSLFPGPEVQGILGAALEPYETTKGTIHFAREKAPPKAFVKKLVEARIMVINRSYPKKSGEFLEFYSHGRLKAQGKYKDNLMHGPWKFFRRDGSLMRAGSFTRGEQSGTWTTYTRDGVAHTSTHFS